jgi:hypothetical protein
LMGRIGSRRVGVRLMLGITAGGRGVSQGFAGVTARVREWRCRE